MLRLPPATLWDSTYFEFCCAVDGYMRKHEIGPFGKRDGEVGARWTADDIERTRATMAELKEQFPDSVEESRKLRRLRKRQLAGAAPPLDLRQAIRRLAGG